MKRVPYTIVIDTKDDAARDLLLNVLKAAHEDYESKIVSLEFRLDHAMRGAVHVTGEVLVLEASDYAADALATGASR